MLILNIIDHQHVINNFITIIAKSSVGSPVHVKYYVTACAQNSSGLLLLYCLIIKYFALF